MATTTKKAAKRVRKAAKKTVKTAKRTAKKAVKTAKRVARNVAPEPKHRDVGKSYAEAKRAFTKLWDDVARESHLRFNGIAKSVEKKFDESRKRVTEGDVHVVLEKAKDIPNKFLKSGAGWIRVLGSQVKLLYELLRDGVSGKFDVPWATIAAITAALMYVVMPIDVLPDFIPGMGLVDDAMVIAFCVSLVRIDLRRYAKHRKLDLAQFGL